MANTNNIISWVFFFFVILLLLLCFVFRLQCFFYQMRLNWLCILFLSIVSLSFNQIQYITGKGIFASVQSRKQQEIKGNLQFFDFSVFFIKSVLCHALMILYSFLEWKQNRIWRWRANRLVQSRAAWGEAWKETIFNS